MMVFVAWSADRAVTQQKDAIAANDPAKLRQISHAIEHGTSVWRSWAEMYGGSLVNEGSAQIDAAHLEDLPRIKEQYESAIGGPATVGIGQKLAEAARALLCGKLKGGDQVVLFTPEVEAEIQKAKGMAKAEPSAGMSPVSPEMSSPAIAEGMGNAGMTGAHQPAPPKAPMKPRVEGSEHSQGEAAANYAEENAVSPEGTHAAQDLEDQFHDAAEDSDDDEPQSEDPHVIRQKVVQVLQEVKSQAKTISALKEAAPDAYKVVMDLVSEMIAIARQIPGAGGAGDPGDKSGEVKKSEKTIKLTGGGKKPPPAALKFMEEFHAATEHNGIDDRLGRVHANESLIAAEPMPEFWHAHPTVHVGWLQALQEGHGAGTRAMQFVTQLADKHGVRLELSAGSNRGGFNTAPKKFLRTFYAKHGFAASPRQGADVMHRMPGAKSGARRIKKDESDYRVVEKDEKPAFTEAAFLHKPSGVVYGVGPFHDIAKLPTDYNDEYEDGFITHDGQFLTREQADELAGKGKGANLQSEDLREFGLGAPVTKNESEQHHVYRVENAAGEGPYKTGDAEAGRRESEPAARAHRLRPEVFEAMDQNGYKFGFENPQQAINWFGGKSFRALQQKGFKLVQVPAQQVWQSKSGTQCIYAPAESLGKTRSRCRTRTRTTTSSGRWAPSTTSKQRVKVQHKDGAAPAQAGWVQVQDGQVLSQDGHTISSRQPGGR
jgi:hypothetical protein